MTEIHVNSGHLIMQQKVAHFTDREVFLVDEVNDPRTQAALEQYLDTVFGQSKLSGDRIDCRSG